MAKSKVYFTKDLSSHSLVKLFDLLDKKLTGNVAVKIHSGEEGNQNYLRPDYLKEIVDYVNGTVVECNTAYDGERNTTEKHLHLIENHGWSKVFKFDLLDATGPDIELDIPNGVRIKKNYIGKDFSKYDSMLIVSHFKGHPMGGFGGALKQLSIGCASGYGKLYIHGAGDTKVGFDAEQDSFLESMADAAGSVIKYFDGKILYINVMRNLSVDCDCCAVAEDPCMKDIGILASTDPVAIDQACIDLIYSSKDPGRDHFVERVETRHGIHTIETAAKIGYGSREYELINVEFYKIENSIISEVLQGFSLKMSF